MRLVTFRLGEYSDPLLNVFGAIERLAFVWGPCCRAKIRILFLIL